MIEHPPIYPDEQGDWSAANRGHERRIREWVAQGVHLQAHHVAYVLAQLDSLREQLAQADASRASLHAALRELCRYNEASVMTYPSTQEWIMADDIDALIDGKV